MTPALARKPRRIASPIVTIFAVLGAISSPAQMRDKPALPSGVEEVCSIAFDKDTLRPARVENSALPCLKQAARRLKAASGRKLVLVGVKDPAKDHEPTGVGSDREEEDVSGFDVRLEDLSGYRAVNTKWYLVRYLNVSPKRILPTTDESLVGQSVTLYLVPASADFNHNFLNTTKINEKPCTITPCYPADEETLQAQRRPPIVEGAVDGSLADKEAERKEFIALQRRRSPIDMTGLDGDSPLAPLLPRPTPEHPATTSIIPK